MYFDDLIEGIRRTISKEAKLIPSSDIELDLSKINIFISEISGLLELDENRSNQFDSAINSMRAISEHASSGSFAHPKKALCDLRNASKGPLDALKRVHKSLNLLSHQKSWMTRFQRVRSTV